MMVVMGGLGKVSGRPIMMIMVVMVMVAHWHCKVLYSEAAGCG